MSSGATSVLAPPKPWEQRQRDAVPLNSLIPSSTINSSPPALPPPPLPSSQSSFSTPLSMYNNNSNGYYNPAYPTSPSPYFAGYPSAPSNYYGNSYPYAMGANGNPSFAPYSLENSARPFLDSLNHIIQAVNHAACFLDSTFFSLWTAISSITGLISALKSCKDHRWLLWLRNKLKELKEIKGRKRLFFLAIILSSVLVAVSSLKSKVETDESSKKKLETQSIDVEVTPITVSEDDFVFVRANYSFEPSNPDQLSFQAGDVIIVNKTDSAIIEDQNTKSSKWIVGRIKDGRSGFLPSNYVSIIK